MLNVHEILMKEDQNPFEGAIGFFKVEKVDSEGTVVDTSYSKNVITFTATNIFARALGGDLTYTPTHIWVGGALPVNVPSPFPTVSRSDTTLDTETDPLARAGNVRAELPISSKIYTAVATTGAPAGQQNNNIITFTATMPQFPDDVTLTGKSFFEAGIITKIGSENLLFSHQFHTALTKEDGFTLVYSWSVRFF